MKHILSSIFFLSLFASAAVSAEPVCMPSDELAASLIDWYEETPVDADLGPDLQLWASAQTGSWTLVRQSPLGIEGVSCSVGSGTGYTPGIFDKELLALAAGN